MNGFSSGVAPGRATLSAALLDFLCKDGQPLQELLDTAGWPVGTPVDATLLQRVADVAAQHSAEAFLYDFGCFALTSMLDGDQSHHFWGETYIDCLRSWATFLHFFADTSFAVPECWTENVTPSSATLHYNNCTPGLASMYTGMLNAVAMNVYRLDLNWRATTPPSGSDHCHQVHQLQFSSPVVCGERVQPPNTSRVGLSPEAFLELFPFHFAVDRHLNVVQAGHAIARMIPAIAQPGAKVGELLQITQPTLPWDWERLVNIQPNTRLVLSNAEGTEVLKGGLHVTHEMQRSGEVLHEGQQVLLFLGSPALSSFNDFKTHGLYLKDLPAHDMATDVSFFLLADRDQHDKSDGLLAHKRRLKGKEQQTEEAEEYNELLKDMLAETLAVHDTAIGRDALPSHSAADLTISLLDQLVVGQEVDVEEVLMVRQALLHAGSDVWQPLQFKGYEDDEEVNEALIEMLGANRQKRQGFDYQLSPQYSDSGGAATAADFSISLFSNGWSSAQQHVEFSAPSHTAALRQPALSGLLSRAASVTRVSQTRDGSPSARPAVQRLGTRRLSALNGSASSPQVEALRRPSFVHCLQLSSPSMRLKPPDVAGSQTLRLSRALSARFASAEARVSVAVQTEPDKQQKKRGWFSGNLMACFKPSTSISPSHSFTDNHEAGKARGGAEEAGTCAPCSFSKKDNSPALGSPRQPLEDPTIRFAIGMCEQAGPAPVSCEASHPAKLDSPSPSLAPAERPSTAWTVAFNAMHDSPASAAPPNLSGSRGLVSAEFASTLARLPSSGMLQHCSQSMGGPSMTARQPAGGDGTVTRRGPRQLGSAASAADEADILLLPMQPKLRPRSAVRKKSNGDGLTPEITVKLLLAQPPDELASLLQGVDEWQFDSFELERVTAGRPLSCLSFYLLKRMGLIKQFHLNENRLIRFLYQIEDGYADNPYHCRAHAADVLRTLHVLLMRGGVLDTVLKGSGQHPEGGRQGKAFLPEDMQQGEQLQFTLFSCYFAAITHDHGHRGVTNDFLVRSGDPLAILYNDLSPQENHHVASSFTVLQREALNFFPKNSKRLQDALRKHVIECVLATDMKQHFSLAGLFASRVPRAAGDADPKRAATHGASKALAEGDSGSGAWDAEAQMLALKMALKMSDLGHLASSEDVHRQWVERLQEEMWRQGDREKALGQPISPLMDRTKSNLSKSQVGFFTVVVLPMATSFASAFPGAKDMLENIRSNYLMWSNQAKQEQ